MSEPTGHCPYLGLKQNRAIRFASPTPEHRCYVSGEPLEIPVDQASYCLSQGHVHCPLYMGLSVPTTSDSGTSEASSALAASAGGMRGWLNSLSPRDRAIYTIMIGMLAIIVAIYLFVGFRSISWPGGASDTTQTASAATATQAVVIVEPPTQVVEPSATSVPPTPTDLPTDVPSPTSTTEPTAQPIILPPTAHTTQPPTNTTVATSVAATTAPAATAAPIATSKPVPPKPSSTPKPAPTASAPTSVPPVAGSNQLLTLYFEDSTGSVLVPVQRSSRVVENRVAEAAVRELLAGPRNGLGRLLAANVQLRGISIADGTATVDFDRDPANGDDRGYDSLVLTLTELGTIARVQIQVNGANLDGLRARPIVNPVNPQNLPFDYGATEFLPLYFLSVDGAHDVRIISMVPKTKQVGEATVRALLAGPPSEYAGVVRRVIPAGTELRGIKLQSGVLLVDFTQSFANAPDLSGAMRTVVESLTSIKSVGGVQFLVEGQAFADGKIFRRPAINQE